MKHTIKVIKELLESKIGKRLAREIVCLLLLAFGVSRQEIMNKIGASHTTLCKYNKMIEEERVVELFEAELYRPVSELEKYSSEIEEEFEKKPPKTRGEAQERIKRLTGIERSLPVIGKFLKKKV
jgi:transposase